MRIKVISYVICALMITTILVIEVPKDVSAQVTEEWVAIYDGPGNSADRANDIAIGPTGNIYVTGMSTGASTGNDVCTVAYDCDGNILWSARYDGPGGWADEAYAITTDLAGNIYVTGTSHSIIKQYDYLTIAYDSMGNKLWVARYNGPANHHDRTFAIANDSSGYIYITGGSHGIGTGDDYATIKYDSFGNEVWIARWSSPGASNIERAKAIAVDSWGNVYVTGIGHYGEVRWDYTTIKYDSFGNELWIARYSFCDAGVEGGEAISLDPTGNLYITGTHGTIAYASSGNVLWTQKGYEGRDVTTDLLGNVYVTGWTPAFDIWGDYITIAYNSTGSELWNATYNGPGNKMDRANVIALDRFGNVFVAGGSDGVGIYQDYTTVAYDSSGNELWVATYNSLTNLHDSINGIVVDSQGNIYVTGEAGGCGIDSDWVTIKYSQEKPILQVTIDVDPDTLNLKSKGRWITAYITLFGGYDIDDIIISSVLLEDTIPAEWGDVQGETLMVKFDRSEVEDMLSPGTYNLKVTGELTDETTFEGYSDEIRVIEPP